MLEETLANIQILTCSKKNGGAWIQSMKCKKKYERKC